MGRGHFDEVPEYAAVERDVDSLLGYSLRTLCLEDAENRLKQTQFTQPSLYVVNALHCYAALRSGPPPAYVAGHSLGEYSALLAAGVFDFMTGLRLVKMRGELMARARDGGMGAVIGLSPSKIAEVIETNGLTSIDVANFNSPSQTVVSGPTDAIKRAGPYFERSGARMFMPLQVSAAFHSRYMADAAAEFASFLAPMSFAAPRIPVVANVTADLYASDDASEVVKAMLVKQITHPVRWTQSVQFLQSRGVNEFKEIGPGNVLAKLVQQIH
jgi:malonyl CoA-acyl carrier protein transacylase